MSQYVDSLYRHKRGQAELGGARWERLRATRVIWREVNVAGNNDNPAPVEHDTEVVQPLVASPSIILVVLVLIVVAAAAFWWRSTFYEDTDDAQVSGHLIQVSARIQGQIRKVYVDENQPVKAGDVIAELGSAGLSGGCRECEGGAGQRRGQRLCGKRECAADGHQYRSTLSSASRAIERIACAGCSKRRDSCTRRRRG